MRGMLVYDVQAVLKLDQPVCVKYLADQPVFRADIPFQEIFFKKIQLLRLL